jgi:hypothetical protein
LSIKVTSPGSAKSTGASSVGGVGSDGQGDGPAAGLGSTGRDPGVARPDARDGDWSNARDGDGSGESGPGGGPPPGGGSKGWGDGAPG